MNVILIPPSDRELEEAISYYNTQQEKLGERFYQEFLRTLRYILIAPDSWRKVGTNTRRANIRDFPYLVLYIHEPDAILITCIAHQHRDPVYYSERIY